MAAMKSETDALADAKPEDFPEKGMTFIQIASEGDLEATHVDRDGSRVNAERVDDLKATHDIYVRMENVLRVRLRSQEVADGVILDWARTECGAGPEQLVGVEVLGARSVRIDGVRTAATPVPSPDRIEKAAEAACNYYLDEMLTLPRGLSGIRYHELGEDGKDVYRELVKTIAAKLGVNQ